MKNLLNLMMKEKRVVMIAVASSFALFLLYFIFFYTPVYSSDAKIFIKDVPQQGIIADHGAISLVKSESGYSNPLFNLAQVLKSKNTSVRVLGALEKKYEKDIRKIDMKNDDEWHEYLSDQIKTKIIPSTDTLSISLKWVNKNTTNNVLNEIIDQFKSENMDIRKSVAVNQRKYLDKNLIEISNKLSDVQKQIRNYTMQNNAVNLDVEKEILVQARVEMERDLEMTRSEINYYDKKYKELSKQIGIEDVNVALRSASIGQDPYLNNLFTNLALSQQEFANLNSTFTENYPKVLAIKHEIQTLKEVIKDRQGETFKGLEVETNEIRGIYDAPSQEIVKEMAMAKAEKQSLIGQLKQMQKGVYNLRRKEARLPEKILGLEELEKQESALKSAYENVKAKQLEARLNENSIVDNIFILDSPSKPKFVFTDLLFKLVGFLYLGVLAGIAAAWIKEYVANKLEVNDMESYAV